MSGPSVRVTVASMRANKTRKCLALAVYSLVLLGLNGEADAASARVPDSGSPVVLVRTARITRGQGCLAGGLGSSCNP